MDSRQKIIRLFQNAGIDSQLEEGRRVPHMQLVNILNYINFQDGSVHVIFKHIKLSTIISIEAKPLPCFGNTLDCAWISPQNIAGKLNSYEFHSIFLTDGLRLVIVKAVPESITEKGIRCILPDKSFEISTRTVRRHGCSRIRVELIQNGAIFHGDLLDFNAFSFSLEATVLPPQSFLWINPDSTIYVILKNDDIILYSGECKIIRHTLGTKKRIFVLKPIQTQSPRFKPKICRSRRYQLSPTPNIFFKHPITQKMVNLAIEDLSGSGFSVQEFFDNAVLLPGLIILELYLEIVSNCTIKCKAQVIYSLVWQVSDETATARCGIAFLDMDIQDQIKLSNLLHQMQNKGSQVCSKVDMDSLWRFFFEVGFVYPKKYATIHPLKEIFKETYERLYIKSPSIARHFIYQDKGIILGHISMVHAYENTWLFHHHAANKIGSKRAGLVVLYQIGQYVNDFYHLSSTHLHYIICYYRPDNRFPQRFFGGVRNAINNQKICSIDPFAFALFSKSCYAEEKSSITMHEENAELVRTQPDDIFELESFYGGCSGGLILNALDLEPEMLYGDTLNKKYQEAGFRRERHLFSLKKDGNLMAIFLVGVADFGLNLSNITNGIHSFVIDCNNLSRNLFNSALQILAQYYDHDEISVLIFPADFAEKQSIPVDKIYNSWVLNVPQGADQYYRYTDTLLLRSHDE